MGLLGSEIAVAGIVGIDDDLVYDYFGVYHYELQDVLAGGGIGEADLQPSYVVEHLVAAEHLPSVQPATEQQIVMRRQGLQVFRLCEVLLGVLLKLIVQTLSGIDDLHRLIVELHTETQATSRHDILSRQYTNRYF